MTGVGVSQIIAFVATPILTRIYQPADFGQLAVFISVVSVVTVAASGRYELAIPVAESPDDASALAIWSGVLAFGVTTVLAALLWLWLTLTPTARFADVIQQTWWTIPLAVWFFGTWKVLNFWYTRQEQFRRISVSHILRGLVTVGVQGALGFMGSLGALGLTLGYVAGQFSATAIMLQGCAPSWSLERLRGVEWRELRRVAVKYSDFLRFGTGQALVNSLSQNVAVLVVAQFFTNGVVGLYALAYRIVMVPINLVGNSVRQIVYQRLAVADPGVRRYQTWRRSTMLLATIALGPVVVLAIFGPALFAWLMGAEWRTSGVIARVLAIPLAMSLVNPPTTSVMPILQKQRVHMIYEIVSVVLRVSCLVLGGLAGNVLLAVGAAGGVNVVMNLWLMGYVARLLRREVQRVAST